jgi:quercetin 2,3-dioxygenase
MITIRKSQDRGHFNLGWLDTYHTFSFDRYYDPAHMGFRSLRVINEDRVRPGQGFPTHSHRDMEIITYVLKGALEHRDSMGNGSVIRAGEVQRMTAGTGVSHSESNPSQGDPVHFLQIWIRPKQLRLPPGYAQKSFPNEQKTGRWCLIASENGREGSMTIHQDADLYATILASGLSVTRQVAPQRHAWIQVVRGATRVNDLKLEPGDGTAVSNEGSLTITAEQPAEVLLFDLA